MVHRSLVGADNALALQSRLHPDGWGVAYYLAGVPHIVKSDTQALSDKIFKRVSGIVASETVLAHIRRATEGPIAQLNSHPFQYGKWVFAHNGQINDFPKHRAALMSMIGPHFCRYILGDTDSEVLFWLVMSELSKRVDVHRPGTPFADIRHAVATAKSTVQRVCDGPSPEEKSLLTTVLTDGSAMIGARVGKPLLFSTHKKRCPDREICPFLSPQCEAAAKSGHVNHLLLTSEHLQGDNVWTELADGEFAGVDWRMDLHMGALDGVRVGQGHFPADIASVKPLQPRMSPPTPAEHWLTLPLADVPAPSRASC